MFVSEDQGKYSLSVIFIDFNRYYREILPQGNGVSCPVNRFFEQSFVRRHTAGAINLRKSSAMDQINDTFLLVLPLPFFTISTISAAVSFRLCFDMMDTALFLPSEFE
jgi:hypothetical protein